LALVPRNVIVTVKSVLSHEQSTEFAIAGDNVDVVFKDADPALFSVGDVLCDPENPLVPVRRFVAQLITFTDVPKPLLNGQIVELYQHTMSMPATIKKLRSLLERNGEVKQLNPR
jgi:translation elongation factor EF-1alpha